MKSFSVLSLLYDDKLKLKCLSPNLNSSRVQSDSSTVLLLFFPRLVRRGWCWRSVTAGWTWFGLFWPTGPTSTFRTTRAPRRWCAPASTATSRSSNSCLLNLAVTPRSATMWVPVTRGEGKQLILMSTFHWKTDMMQLTKQLKSVAAHGKHSQTNINDEPCLY